VSRIVYAPPYAVADDAAALRAFICERTFATLVAVLGGEAAIAHAPVVLGQTTIQFHLARGNAFLDAASAGMRAQAVFHGPDAYISPDWYVSENQVPTWNYAAVYVEGPMRILSRGEMIAQVDALSAEQEEKLAPKKPWTRAKMAPGLDERLLAAIQGVELRIEKLEGKFKLSQNKTAADIEGAAAALDALGKGNVAALMRATAK
jgi:transcriptional regulator